MKRTAPIDTDESPSPKKQKTEPLKYPNIPVDAEGLLSSLIYPLDTETFINRYWTKQVYATCINNSDRVKDLLDGPFPFHLKTLLQETASDKIHVWMSSKSSSKKGELLSFTVDDWESALSCYHCGGSLYFRASPEFTDVFIASLMSDLGVGIGSNYNSNELRGEIEVFVSRRNHLTNWHYDFQHNFTLQLSGHKRWYLLPIEAENGSFHNVKRGNTPHFSQLNESDLAAKECQIKLHQSESHNFDFDEWKKFDVEQKYADKIKIIDLKPGSTMYFPAGCWHKVETVSDESLSINLSIVPLTCAELVSNAINHFMIKQPIFRQPILHSNNGNKDVLKELCGKLKGFIDHIAEYPSCVVPCSFSNYLLSANTAICVETFDFESIDAVKAPVVCTDDCFVVNPLSVMIKFDDVYGGNERNRVDVEKDKFCSFDDLISDNDDEEEEGEGDDSEMFVCQYILHLNFGENDTYSSTSRVIMQCKNEETVRIIEWIRKLKSSDDDNIQIKRFTVKCIKELMKSNKMTDDEIYHVLRVFAFFGWISMKNK